MMDAYRRIAERLRAECVERDIITESEFYCDRAANILREELTGLIAAAGGALRTWDDTEGCIMRAITEEDAERLRTALEGWR